MEKQNEYAAQLQLLADKVESGQNKQISSILKENSDGRQHIMLIEDEILEKGYKIQPMDEYYLLEKVDLLDFWSRLEFNGHKTR